MSATLTLSESTVVSKSQCPQCAERGRDRSEDNLATYSDGHVYCYRCKYYRNGDKRQQTVLSLKQAMLNAQAQKQRIVKLPDDLTNTFPYQAGNWLASYGIEKEECLRDGIGWSDSLEGIVFPFYTVDKNKNVCVQGYQVRNFHKERPKYVTQGPRDDIFWYHGLEHAKKRGIILVEDCVSAMKVGRYACTLPLLGSNLARRKQVDLYKSSDKLFFWLDNDVANDAYKYAASCAAQGYETQVIVTPEDPKW